MISKIVNSVGGKGRAGPRRFGVTEAQSTAGALS